MWQKYASKLRAALPWVITLALLYLVVMQMRPNLVPTGTKVPSFSARLHDGTTFDLRAQKGQVIVLNFWGTYCGPCRKEGPVLTKIHRKLQREQGTVIGVAVDNHPLSSVTAAARQFGMRYPIALGTQAQLGRFRVKVVPSTYIIGRDGFIKDSFVGAVSESRLMRAVDKVLGKAG